MIPDHETMVSNILSVYAAAPADIVREGRAWYADAYDWCADLAEMYDLPTERVAAIVAHLSPMSSWVRNKMLATTMVVTGDCKHLSGAQIRKARAVRDGADIEPTFGPDRVKVWCFWRNILGDQGLVTVDRHAAAIAGVPKEQSMGKRLYAAVSAAYWDAAERCDLTPAELQAVTWCQWRGTGA